MTQLQHLHPGTAFNSPVLDANCRIHRWQPGVLIYCNVSRARVQLDGSTHESNWPPTLEVEPVRGPNWEGEPTMDQKHKALTAKYRYQMSRLEAATATGDPEKVKRAELAVAKTQAEADELGLALELDTTGGHTFATATTPTTTTNPLAAVGAAQESPEMVQTKSARKQATKAAEEARKVKLVAKKKAANKETALVRKSKESKGAATGENSCLCGCGTKVGGRFAPGHDARVKGMLLRVERGEEPKANLPEGLLAVVKFAGREGTEGFKLVSAPVKFPGREDVAVTAVA